MLFIVVVKWIFVLLMLVNLPACLKADKKENSFKVSCKDENGENVDWFYLYKLPKHYSAKHNKSADDSGLHYLFVTSKSFENWHFSSYKMNESLSMPALTLEPLFANDSVLLLAYNDEFPNGTVIFDGGHTKGVVASDGVTGGLWLIHSVPKFPAIPKYEYPSTGSHYGQSLLCVSLAASEMEKVGEQLLFNEPNIYYHRVPKILINKFPTLEKAIQKDWIKLPPFNNVLNLVSLEGTTFKSFAKSSRFTQELYEDFLAPTLDTNLLVETWRNGAGNLASNCSRNDKVYNIQSIQSEDFNLDFKTTQDHSKWAVSQAVGLKFWRWRFPKTSNWLCVGDINRQQHQLLRGGGVLCQQNSKISKLYRSLVKEYEACTKK